MAYRAHFKDEVLSIIERIENVLGQRAFSKNLYETQTLCYCFLVAINEIIRGAFAAIENSGLLAARITFRSLTEYIVDLMLIAIRDSQLLNRQFAEYHKLSMFWASDLLSHHLEEKERLERNYHQYIIDNMDRLRELVPDDGRLVLPKQIGEELKKKYRHRWYHLAYREKVMAVVVYAVYGPDVAKPISVWDRVEKSLSNSRCDWSDLPHDSRIELIVGELVSQCSQRPLASFQDLKPFLSIAFTSYKYDCSFTHPSIHGVVPHMVPVTGLIQTLSRDYKSETLRDSEEFIVLCLWSTVYAFSWSLVEDERCIFKENFDRMLFREPHLKEWLLTFRK